MLTVAQAAERLRMNPETIRRWLRAGKLRGVSWGSARAGWRVAESELERFKHEGPHDDDLQR